MIIMMIMMITIIIIIIIIIIMIITTITITNGDKQKSSVAEESVRKCVKQMKTACKVGLSGCMMQL